jgi:hypothetical protein
MLSTSSAQIRTLAQSLHVRHDGSAGRKTPLFCTRLWKLSSLTLGPQEPHSYGAEGLLEA